jgi:hypothetical protein
MSWGQGAHACTERLHQDPVTTSTPLKIKSVHLVEKQLILVEEFGLHYGIDEKRHVCLNDVFGLRRQSDGIQRRLVERRLQLYVQFST